jgi:fluoride exporter
MKNWLMVVLGGGLGSACRHAVNRWAVHRFENSVPLATGVVNLAGCAIIGGLAGLIAGGRLRMDPSIRTLVFVGVLGGFTTFSSFGLDTLTLVHEGRRWLAIGNVLVQVCLGLLLVFGGYWLGSSR